MVTEWAYKYTNRIRASRYDSQLEEISRHPPPSFPKANEKQSGKTNSFPRLFYFRDLLSKA